MKKGFTLIELVVAIGVLAMMLGFVSIVFRMSIKGSRVVNANAEIMQKLRGITDQIDRDLGGLDKDMPLFIWFEKGNNLTVTDDPNRFDQMMFFATGDFQSTQLYNSTTEKPVEPDLEDQDDKPVTGSSARIYYGQAQSTASPAEVSDRPSERILCRRRHIFSDDTDVTEWPTWNTAAGSNLSDFDYPDGDGYLCNDRYEHDSLSLSQWKEVIESTYSRTGNGIIETVFEHRPQVEMTDVLTYHNLLSEQVASFKIQFGYWNRDNSNEEDDQLRWFPSDDPDKDGMLTHSHFQNQLAEKFGIYFNIDSPDPDDKLGTLDWFSINNDNVIFNYKKAPNRTFVSEFGRDFYPQALKFTFTIYDSKGIIKNGRTFTHIVYIGE